MEENHPLSLTTDTRSEIARTMIARSEATRKKYLEKATDKEIKMAAAQKTTCRDDETYEPGEHVWLRDV